MRIEDIMTRDVRSCGPHDSLMQAAQFMWDGDCGALPVVDENKRTVAMITDRDICMAAYTRGLPLDQMDVSSAASHELYCAHEADSVETVAATMVEHKVRRVPVVDGEGRPIGIISLNDLARIALESPEPNTGRRTSTAAIARTPASVAEPKMEKVSLGTSNRNPYAPVNRQDSNGMGTSAQGTEGTTASSPHSADSIQGSRSVIIL
jgi:CBS domain-containing protein